MKPNGIVDRWLRRFEDGARYDHLVEFRDEWMDVLSADPDLYVALREDYVNVYHRGQSMARVEFAQEPRTGVPVSRVVLHGKFAGHILPGECTRLPGRDDYRCGRLERGEVVSSEIVVRAKQGVEAWFKREEALAPHRAALDFHREIEAESAILKCSRPSPRFFFIDRQIADHVLAEDLPAGMEHRPRMDLLALEQISGAEYRMVLIELKLPNNTDLSGKVAKQVSDYLAHLSAREHRVAQAYVECYARHYEQKRFLGLLSDSLPSSITIDPMATRAVVAIAHNSGGRVSAEDAKQMTVAGDGVPVIVWHKDDDLCSLAAASRA